MKNKKIITLLVAVAAMLFGTFAKADTGDFVLFNELAEIKGIDLIMLVIAAVLVIGLAYAIIVMLRNSANDVDEAVPPARRTSSVRAIVFGAMALSLSFVLSYIKLFEMPFGGAITLCSMLPIVIYCSWFGCAYGFTVAFAYGLLQIIQGAYIIHPIQFVLDYILAFTLLGLASFFRTRKTLPLGILVAGFARLLCSVLSGVVFFAEYAPEGMNVWAYSFIYNALSLGVDTLICFIVYIIPPVNSSLDKLKQSVIG